MKHPKEIKKGLECCANSSFCDEECPYFEERNHEGLDSHPSDALALIQQLEAENDDLRLSFAKQAREVVEHNLELLKVVQQCVEKIPKWISVEERLPETQASILIVIKDGEDVRIAIGNRTGWIPHRYYIDGGHYVVDADCVTHWMPLPEPPKEDAHG